MHTTEPSRPGAPKKALITGITGQDGAYLAEFCCIYPRECPQPIRESYLLGTGTPRREFLYSDDLAKACVYLMGEAGRTEALFTDHEPPLVNIGCGEDVTIAELAGMVAEAVGFEGKIVFDVGKPDGTPQKLLDVSRMRGMGWRPSVSLPMGIGLAYGDYVGTCRNLTSEG